MEIKPKKEHNFEISNFEPSWPPHPNLKRLLVKNGQFYNKRALQGFDGSSDNQVDCLANQLGNLQLNDPQEQTISQASYQSANSEALTSIEAQKLDDDEDEVCLGKRSVASAQESHFSDEEGMKDLLLEKELIMEKKGAKIEKNNDENEQMEERIRELENEMAELDQQIISCLMEEHQAERRRKSHQACNNN